VRPSRRQVSCRVPELLAAVLLLSAVPLAAMPPGGRGAVVTAGAGGAEEVEGAAVADPRVVSTEAALSRFAPGVRHASHPDALRTAFRAYYSYRAAYPERVRKPYLYFVDLGLDNRTPRGWVFDMDALELVEGPFPVAHGVGSSRERDAVPQLFSNQPGSKASSLGLYLAEETYAFSGRSGSGRYSSVGLRMRGESGPFNDAARRRGIVAHGAPYVTPVAAGRSEGCPAMEQHRARRLLPMLADGGVVFIYSPNHPTWLGMDPWVNAE
jgi:hypothetical protein